MAAASCRTRRRTQLPRKRKQTTRRKAVRRKLPSRRRKGPLRRESQQCKIAVRQSGPPKKRSCDEFISKVLRRLHRDRVQISTRAKGKMISFIRRFYKTVSEKAGHSKRAQRTCTIGSKELQKALKRVMRKQQATELTKTIQKVSRRH